MSHFARCALVAALAGGAVASSAAQERPALTKSEKAFLHAAGIMTKFPDATTDEKGLAKLAFESAGTKGEKLWVETDDPVLRALAKIEGKAEYRERYQASLKKYLGDDPEGNGKKLFAKIERDYAPGKVVEYRKLVADSGKDLRPGALPWPLCIPFNCCE